MSMSGLPGTFVAGADPRVFNGTIDVTVTQTLQNFRSIAAQFDVKGSSGLTAGQAHFAWRLQSGGSWHNVGFDRHDGLLQATFYPYQNVLTSGHTDLVMRLSFGDRVQSQSLQIGMDLVGSARKSDPKELARTGPFGAAVLAKAGGVQPPATTPTPVATPTQAPTTAASDPATDVGVPGDTSTPDNTGALPGVTPTNADAGNSGIWVLYIIGGLLLVGGIGVIGTLLWKRSAGTTEWPDPNDPSLYGDQNQTHPAQAYPVQAYPTQTYPAQEYPAQTYPDPANHPQPGAHRQGGPGGRPPIDPTRQMPSL